MKKIFTFLASIFTSLFTKKDDKTIKIVNVIKEDKKEDVEVEPKEETPKKVSIEEIVDYLDKIQDSNDDLFTNIGLLVAEIDDVYKAPSKADREKQKVECYRVLDYIKSQLVKM